MERVKTHTVDKFLEPDGFGFYVEWLVEPHWANFKVFEVIEITLEEDDTYTPGFESEDATNSSHTTTDRSNAAPYLEGYIKWDGCAEFGQRHHYCGQRAFKAHAQLMFFLYMRAPVLMGRGWDGLDDPWIGRGPVLTLQMEREDEQ